jgi:hypothetical protein
MNTVFATEYITKRTDNKLLDTAYDVAKNNNITDIKIQSVSVVKKSGNSCLVTVSFMDKIPKYEKSNYKFYPHFLISISKKDTERYIYPETMDKFVKDKSSEERIATILGMFLSKLPYGKKEYQIDVLSENICNSEKIDVYVFVPNEQGWNKWDNVYYHTGDIGFYSADLKDEKSKLHNVRTSGSDSANPIKYFFNVDYAYGVPVTTGSSVEPSCKSLNDQLGNKGYKFVPSTENWFDARLYNDNPVYVCVSCLPSNPQKQFVVYNPKNKADFEVYDWKNFNSENYPADLISKFKKAVGCFDTTNTPPLNETPSAPSDVGSDTTEEQVEPVAPQQVNLDFTVYSSIPDISYSTTTATQYKARKVNDQEAYLIDYRNNKKEISVNLSSLNYTRPVYAILATPDQSDKIYGYLANIKSTGEFKDYTLQTNFTVNSNTLATSPAAMKYTMGSDKTFKFSIAPNVNDKFVLIFMQLSDDGSLINLTYTNLYNLDYNAQSIYQLCEINRNIVNFYCKGYDCKVPGSCIDRWDFDPSKLDGVSGIPVDAIPVAPTSPKPPLETPPATPKPPLETPPATPTPPVSQDTTLAKGADGCYTTNPETLAKIRQEGGIGINKQQFAGKRTKSSIVFPGTSNGTDDDPSLTVDQIKNVFNRPSLNIPQKVKDASPAFYNLGLLYNVDPVYSLAFFRAEKSLYNQNSGSVTQTLISHNDISGVTRVCRCGGKKVVGSKYCSYPTLEQGIEAFYLNLDKGTTNSPNIYKNKSFAQVAKTWNGHDSYVTSITRYLADTYVWAGK